MIQTAVALIQWQGAFDDREKAILSAALRTGLRNSGAALVLADIDDTQTPDAQYSYRFVISAENEASVFYGQNVIRWRMPGLRICFLASGILHPGGRLLIEEKFAAADFNQDLLISKTASDILNREIPFIKG